MMKYKKIVENIKQAAIYYDGVHNVRAADRMFDFLKRMTGFNRNSVIRHPQVLEQVITKIIEEYRTILMNEKDEEYKALCLQCLPDMIKKEVVQELENAIDNGQFSMDDIASYSKDISEAMKIHDLQEKLYKKTITQPERVWFEQQVTKAKIPMIRYIIDRVVAELRKQIV